MGSWQAGRTALPLLLFWEGRQCFAWQQRASAPAVLQGLYDDDEEEVQEDRVSTGAAWCFTAILLLICLLLLRHLFSLFASSAVPPPGGGECCMNQHLAPLVGARDSCGRARHVAGFVRPAMR